MTRITSRFVLLIASAAVAPLVLYGLISVTYLRSGTQDSVTNGNLQVAGQVSERIRLYFDNNVRVLRSVGRELLDTHLAKWQQERVLRNHVLDFPEFREVTLFDPGGRLLATSRLVRTQIALPDPASISESGVYIAPLQLDNDALPTTIISVRLSPDVGQEPAGWSRKSRSKNCGGWSTAFASATRATRFCSVRTAASSPPATRTRSA